MEQAKVTEVDGHKYSRGAFEGYRIRAKAEYETRLGIVSIDVYTTNTDRSDAISVFKQRVTDGNTFRGIVNWTTKEQDDRTSELLDEFLSDK